MNTNAQAKQLTKKNLLKSFFLLLFVFLSSFSFSQTTKAYVYSSTTEESLIELKERVSDADIYSSYLKKIEQLEREGKVILSTDQYYHIKLRIDSVKENPQTEEEVEMKAYVQRAKVKYVSISDLIK